MLEDHRSGPRHDSLLSTYPEDESNSGWMISYIDIMTLLVALFVIIIAAAGVTSPEWSSADNQVEPDNLIVRPLEVPLPDVLDEFRSQRSPVLASTPGTLNPMAISAALGVAGLPTHSVSTFSVPPLLALPEP
ncbi:MAG TPA: flagellar motor protein MotB, partial [Halomonas sp.]|nr:flagellar motor protein MotB [Halomonas sp.]